MNVYQLVRPDDSYRYARALRRGTWAPDPGPGVCPACGSSRQQRVPPLLVMWEPGSAVIGDFSWPGFNDDIIVSDQVRRALEAAFCCAEFHPVAMLDPRMRPRPPGAKQRTKPRVAVPYGGPPLWDLQATAWCGVDQEASGVQLVGECHVCGQVFWHPRARVPHFVLDPRTWNGADVFRVDAYPGNTFCTARLREFIEEQGFTNVGFELRGEIGDRVATSGLMGPYRRSWLPAPLSETAEIAATQLTLPGVEPPITITSLEVDYLPEDSPAWCPVDVKSIVGYLMGEIPDEEISADDLEFVRTAAIEDWQCWLWRFVDIYGNDAYVSASAWPTGSSVLYDPAHGRTPEQFILFDYGLYERDHRTRYQND